MCKVPLVPLQASCWEWNSGKSACQAGLENGLWLTMAQVLRGELPRTWSSHRNGGGAETTPSWKPRNKNLKIKNVSIRYRSDVSCKHRSSGELFPRLHLTTCPSQRKRGPELLPDGHPSITAARLTKQRSAFQFQIRKNEPKCPRS